MNHLDRTILGNFKRFTLAGGYQVRLFVAAPGAKESKTHLLLLSIPVASFCLGTWQVKRLQWKKGLIKDLETRTRGEAVALPNDILTPGKVKEMEYRKITVNGKFDHSQEIILGPRSLNVTGIQTGGLLSRPNIGFYIITPFILDSGEKILVNRGWVPKAKKYKETRLEGQINEHITLTGYVRSGERKPVFSPKVQDSSFSWYYCDVGGFSRILGTMPVLIDADATSTVEGGPIGGQTRVTLRNEHRQYIITWYSLCAATLVLYYQLRKKPGAMSRSGHILKE